MKISIKLLAQYILVILLFISCKNEKKIAAKTEAKKPMNVLFIAIDDLRPELGFYGANHIKSPNLDKLASESLVFNKAYCNVPVCGASRASLLTSILPTKKRFIDYRAKAQEDVPNAKTLPQVFKEAGYTSISNGKIFHYNKDVQDASWSQKPWMPAGGHRVSYDPESEKVIKKSGNGRVYEAPDVADSSYPDYKIAQKTITDLRQLKKSGEPFFMACGFFRPHMPFYAPKKYWDLYDRDSIKIAENRYRPENAPKILRGSTEFRTYSFGDYKPNTKAFDKMMRHGYYACVSYIDQLVGEVINELETLGLAENTIVVVWGDHGWHLGEHKFWGKHNTLHNALQVPLLVKVPNKANGKKTDALVESVDIYPTLCDLANISTPDYVMGESFTSIINNPNESFRKGAYARFKKADAIVGNDFTYTLFEDGEEMLYNRKLDPQENKNVVADVKYETILQEMRSALQKKQQLASSYK